MTIAQEDHLLCNTEQLLLCPVPDCLYDDQQPPPPPPLTSTALLEDHLQGAHGGGVHHLRLASSICFNHLPLFADHCRTTLPPHTHTEAAQEDTLPMLPLLIDRARRSLRHSLSQRTATSDSSHFYFEHEEGVFTCVDLLLRESRGFTAQFWAGVVRHSWAQRHTEY